MSNGKVVGDLNAWALVERKKPAKEKKGVIKARNSPSTDKMVTNNKFESLQEKDQEVGRNDKLIHKQEVSKANNGNNTTKSWV